MSVAARVLFPDPADRMPTILVVEDEALIRVVIAAYLQECGFKVLEAGDAGEAIQILDIDLIPVDLVFTDVKMPGEVDGFALAQWVRANRPGLHVMLTSGDDMKCAAANELSEGDPFFAKPYDVSRVVNRIRRLIDYSAAA